MSVCACVLVCVRDYLCDQRLLIVSSSYVFPTCNCLFYCYYIMNRFCIRPLGIRAFAQIASILLGCSVLTIAKEIETFIPRTAA